MGTGGLVGPLGHSSAWPHLGPRPPMAWGPGGSSPGALWTPEASRTHIYGRKDFVQFRGYFRVGFLKPKTAGNTELALWHLVNRLVPENA